MTDSRFHVIVAGGGLAGLASMVALPAEVLGNQEIMAKLSNLLAAHPELAAPADGPDRAQFAAPESGTS